MPSGLAILVFAFGLIVFFAYDELAEARRETDPKRKKRVLWARITLFIALTVAAALVTSGLFINVAIGTAMSAGSGGGGNAVLGLLIFGFLLAIVGAAYVSFRK